MRQNEETAVSDHSSADEGTSLVNPVASSEHKHSYFYIYTIVLSLFIAAVILTLMAVFAAIFALAVINFLKAPIPKPSSNLNIHLKLSMECEQSAIDLNHRITSLDTTQQIDFLKSSQPHITLYLTNFLNSNFQSTSKLQQSINQTVSSSSFQQQLQAACTVQIQNKITVIGTYAMWDVLRDDCMQFMSDAVVNATFQFIDPQSKTMIPDWIKSLPNQQQREAKISMIQNYGSPNVFSQFEPHVTLAVDSNNPKLLQQAVNSITPQGCSYSPIAIGISVTGPFGTVDRSKPIDIFSLIK